MPRISLRLCCYVVIGCLVLANGVLLYLGIGPEPEGLGDDNSYKPRKAIETSGYETVFKHIPAWKGDGSLEEHGAAYEQAVARGLAALDEQISQEHVDPKLLIHKAGLFHARGDPESAYKVLDDLESRIKDTPQEKEWLYTVIFYKGVSALRMAENDNCVTASAIVPVFFPLLQRPSTPTPAARAWRSSTSATISSNSPWTWR